MINIINFTIKISKFYGTSKNLCVLVHQIFELIVKWVIFWRIIFIFYHL